MDVIGFDRWQTAIEDTERLSILDAGARLGLSRIQTMSVYFYTVGQIDGQSVFSAVNAALRSGAARGTYPMTPAIVDYVDLLTSALDALPAWSGHVYRRLQPPRPIATLVAGATRYNEAGFMSTALDPDVFPGPDMLIIAAKTGKDISALSAYPQEREIVFRPGTVFRVLDIINDSGSNIVVLEE